MGRLLHMPQIHNTIRRGNVKKAKLRALDDHEFN